MALCFNCGHVKFGAICPCDKCGVKSTGDINLDIAFSDHRMSEKTIEAFGGVIRRIAAVEQDPAVRFWTFIAYISRGEFEILKADPPAELAERVDAVLAKAALPVVVVESTAPPPDNGPPLLELPFPREFLNTLQAVQPFQVITVVEVRLRDGSIWACDLIDAGPSAALVARDPAAKFAIDDVVAVRRRRMFKWFPKRAWVERRGASNA